MQYLIGQFKLYNPELADRVVMNYFVSRFRLKCELDDGSTVIFNSRTCILRTYSNSDDTEENWRKRFRHCLFDTLDEKHITQKELSDRTGISEVMLSRYMNGYATPSAYNLKKIADALDCDIDDLFY